MSLYTNDLGRFREKETGKFHTVFQTLREMKLLKKFPFVVKNGNSSVTIYRVENRGYVEFRLARVSLLDRKFGYFSGISRENIEIRQQFRAFHFPKVKGDRPSPFPPPARLLKWRAYAQTVAFSQAPSAPQGWERTSLLERLREPPDR